jgi:hypothetical protein
MAAVLPNATHESQAESPHCGQLLDPGKTSFFFCRDQVVPGPDWWSTQSNRHAVKAAFSLGHAALAFSLGHVKTSYDTGYSYVKSSNSGIFVCRFWLLLAVGLLLAQACAAEIAFGSEKGEDAVNKKVAHERSVAHLSAAQSEKEIAKLVSFVGLFLFARGFRLLSSPLLSVVSFLALLLFMYGRMLSSNGSGFFWHGFDCECPGCVF